MYLMNVFFENNIKVDFNEEIIYGKDDPWGDESSYVPTVEFELMGTPELYRIADRVRIRHGFRLIHPVDQFTDIDPVAYYNFYIKLSDWGTCPVDLDLTFAVCNSDCDDNEYGYQIELKPDERFVIYRILNAQCMKHLGKSCADLMAESKTAMQD